MMKGALNNTSGYGPALPELHKRLRWVALVVIAAFALLIGRLWQLQVMRGESYYERTVSNVVKERYQRLIYSVARKLCPQPEDCADVFQRVCLDLYQNLKRLRNDRTLPAWLITVTRPTITGEMYGILATLLAGRGAQLTPIAAPIAFVPIDNVKGPVFGRVSKKDAQYATYREFIQRTVDEPFAMFISGHIAPD